MTLLSSVAIFFIIWWLCLFVVLPFGVKSQHEAEDVVPGSDPGAPHRPQLLRRALATTLLATMVFSGVYLYFGVYQLRLDDLLPWRNRERRPFTKEKSKASLAQELRD